MNAFLGLLCVFKALLGCLCILFADGDGYIVAAGIGHILLSPFWYWAGKH